MKRWTCPRCGDGKLGPTRPRKNATVRFCLACSADSKTLVERTCPSLENARSKREATKREKRRKDREREKAKREAKQAFVPDAIFPAVKRVAKLYNVRDFTEARFRNRIKRRDSYVRSGELRFRGLGQPRPFVVTESPNKLERGNDEKRI